jgi:hypothetical protein
MIDVQQRPLGPLEQDRCIGIDGIGDDRCNVREVRAEPLAIGEILREDLIHRDALRSVKRLEP